MKIIPVHRQFSITGFFSAFHFSWETPFVFHGESHVFWEIVYVAKGEVESTEEENIYRLRENDIILHAPMEFHRIRSGEGSKPRGIIISFTADGTLPEGLKKGVFSLRGEDQEEYETICEKIISFIKNPSDSPYEGQQTADRLASFLMKLGEETARKSVVGSPGAKEYREIVSDMNRRVGENLTLADFAVAHSVSISYLKLLFKTYAGISPKTYYNQLRARHAAHLLEEDRSIAEVAATMNFSSQNYFTVFFRKHMGCNPSDYRKKQDFQ